MSANVPTEPPSAAVASEQENQHNETPTTAGTPAAGTPAAGTPAAGTPAAGTPAAGTPAARTPAAGTPAAGTPAAGTPAARTPAAGTPAAGTPATGTPAAGTPAVHTDADSDADTPAANMTNYPFSTTTEFMEAPRATNGDGDHEGNAPVDTSGVFEAMAPPTATDTVPVVSTGNDALEHSKDDEEVEAKPSSSMWGSYMVDWTSLTKASTAMDAAAQEAGDVENPSETSELEDDDEEVNLNEVGARIDLKRAKIPVEFASNYYVEKAIIAQNKQDFFLELILFVLFVLLLNFTFLSDRELFYSSYDLRRKILEIEAPPMSYAPGGSPNDGPHFSKSFDSLLKVEDWNIWLERVLIPFYFDPLDPDKKPQDVANFANAVVIPLGGIRIRTLRMTNQSCIPTEGSSKEHLRYFASDYPYIDTCYGHFDDDEGIDKRDIVLPGTTPMTARYEECNENVRMYVGYEYDFPCAGNVLDLSFNLSFNEAASIAKSMVDNNFFDEEATRLISVHTMHALPGKGALTMGLYFVESGPGGHIFPYHQLYTNLLIGSEGLALAVAVFIWCGVLILKDFGRATWNRTLNTHVGGQLVFALLVRASLMSLSVLVIAAYLLTVLVQNDTDTLDNPSGRYYIYSVTMESLMQYYYIFRYVAAACSILMCFRLIYFLQIIPRLRVLSNVLIGSLPFIVGILLYFVAVLIPFFIAGMYLYGNRIVGYSSLGRSIETVALIIVGDFDYDAMERLHPLGTFYYFWAVNILTLFLLINFIMAILSFTFEQMISKQDKEKEEKLISQAQRNSSRPSLKEQDGSWGSWINILWKMAIHSLSFAFSAWKLIRELEKRKTVYKAGARYYGTTPRPTDFPRELENPNVKGVAITKEECEKYNWADYPLFKHTITKHGYGERIATVMFEEAYIAYMAKEKAERAIELDEAPEVSKAMLDGLHAFLHVLQQSKQLKEYATHAFQPVGDGGGGDLTMDASMSFQTNHGSPGSANHHHHRLRKDWGALLVESRDNVLNDVHRVTAQAALLDHINNLFMAERARNNTKLVDMVVSRLITRVVKEREMTPLSATTATTMDATSTSSTTTVKKAGTINIANEPTQQGEEMVTVAKEAGADLKVLNANKDVLRKMVIEFGVGKVVCPKSQAARKSNGIVTLMEYLKEHQSHFIASDELEMFDDSYFAADGDNDNNTHPSSSSLRLVPALREAGFFKSINVEATQPPSTTTTAVTTTGDVNGEAEDDDEDVNPIEYDLLEGLLLEQVYIPNMAVSTITKVLLDGSNGTWDRFVKRCNASSSASTPPVKTEG